MRALKFPVQGIPFTAYVGILIIGVMLSSQALVAQGNSRYQSEIFQNYQLQSNIQYGQAITVLGSTLNLLLDIYTPTGDTATNRPLVIFIHGGGFQSGDKVSNYGTRVCGSLARRGYVVTSINYRLSTSAMLTDSVRYFEALYRGIQDAKAAVRFFRQNASLYGIDTTQIFVTGSSAGSKIALHMAYLGQSEVPSFLNTSVLGTLEGSSGNAGHTSDVQGVISCWGAMWDFQWIQPGNVPVYCVHGTSDVTVPYDSSFSYHGFRYGSLIIYDWAHQMGIPSGITLFSNTGHTLDNSTAKQDSAIRAFSAWLFTILGENQFTTPVREGKNMLPGAPRLHPNFPNPFNPVTTIEYELTRTEYVSINVFDVAGRTVSRLVDEEREAGIHRVVFDASGLSSGTYFCRLMVPEKTEYTPMVLVR